MAESITIKTAHSEQDIAAIAALAKQIWTHHYGPIIGQAQVDYMLDKFQSQAAIARAINEDGYVYSIARLDGEDCGYCGIKLNDGLFLSKFYVKQSHRGKGVGKAMMAAIRTYAQKHNAERIWLTCNKHNTKTLRIYQKLGFHITDEVVTDIGGGFVMDDYVLEQRLDGDKTTV